MQHVLFYRIINQLIDAYRRMHIGMYK
jgi:hypothetical protein